MQQYGKFIMITGGSRSGKSAFGEKLTWELGEERAAYVATAQTLDEEMEERVKGHRQRRPDTWPTFEETLDLAGLLQRIDGQYPVILIDCITMWVSNNLFSGDNPDMLKEAEKLADVIRGMDSRVIAVSGEVGWGLVGESHIARRFIDLLGGVNQILAAAADDVYLTAAGLPLALKEGGKAAWPKR